MLSDSKFIENSLISNLYYLRTLREFCARVQLSLPSNYKEYIDTAGKLAKQCEELGSKIMKYANRNIPSVALNSDILTRFYDDFMNLFDFREQYISSLMSDNVYLSKYGNNFSTSIQTGYFKASIDIDQYGNLFHYVELDIPEHLINNVDKDMVIRDYIANKEKSIMKKIPVDINSLDDVFKNILTNKSKNILIKKRTL